MVRGCCGAPACPRSLYARSSCLLGVLVDRPQQRVDVHIRLGLDALQQLSLVDQVQQMRPGGRGELTGVTVGELAEELSQRGGAYTSVKSRFIPPERTPNLRATSVTDAPSSTSNTARNRCWVTIVSCNTDTKPQQKPAISGKKGRVEA